MEDPPMFLVTRSNGNLYFRRAIPDNLRPFISAGNKREITISLKTKKFNDAARRLHHKLFVESEELLEEAELKASTARSKGHQKPTRQITTEGSKRRPLWEFTNGELQALYHKWYLEEKAAVLESAVLIFNGSSREALSEMREEVGNRLASLRRLEGSQYSPLVSSTLRRLVDTAKGKLEHTTVAEHVLRQLLFEGQLREGLIELADFEKEILSSGVAPKAARIPDSTVPSTPQMPTPVTSISLRELIEKFASDPARQGNTAKTKDEFQIVYNTAKELLGADSPVASITREKVKELQAICKILPAHYSQRFPKKSLREVAGIAQAQNLAPMAIATFNKRMTLLGAIFNFAVDEGVILQSPAKRLTVEALPQAPGEKTFTLSQLNSIFSSQLFKDFVDNTRARYDGHNDIRPHAFWAPLLGLFHGLRQGEIFKLRTDNIAEIDGIHCLKIGYNVEGRAAKTSLSIRIVPINPKIIEFGFLKFVEAVNNRGEKELFTDASLGQTYQSRASNYSKRFSRFLTGLGIKHSRDTCFHSFRHTCVDAMREAEIPVEEIYRLTGWSMGRKNVGETYGGRLHRHLFKQVSRVKFEELDLGFLIPTK